MFELLIHYHKLKISQQFSDLPMNIINQSKPLQTIGVKTHYV